MTADLQLAPSPEPSWWTAYPSLASAADLLGASVAHLPGNQPVSIASPADTAAAPRHLWVRYQDPDGVAYGAATVPHPGELAHTASDTEAVAVSVGTIIRHAGHIDGVFAPDDDTAVPAGPLHIDGAVYPAVAFGAAPGVTVRAARLPDGSVVALWGPEPVLDWEITLTA